MLDLLTTTDETVTLPLGCDPALQRANPARVIDGELDSPLLRYAVTLDVEGLTVPPEALRATVMGASEDVKRAALAEAGRQSFQAERLYRRVLGEATTAEDFGAELAARVDALAARVDALAARVDALTDAEFSLYQQHAAWMRRWHLALIRRCCVELHTPDGVIPGPMLADRLAERTTALGEAVIRDVASLCLRVGSLGKVMPRSCATSSGAPTTTPVSGSAADATAGSSTGSASAAS